MKLRFIRKLDEEFLEYSYRWFCDAELRELTMTRKFTREAQRDWFKSLPERDNYLVFGVKVDEHWVGACGLKNIDRSSGIGEYFGYIGNKEYWGRGIGKKMIRKCESEAVNIGLSCVFLRVEPNNARAISLYKTAGFTGDNLDAVAVIMSKRMSRIC